MTKAEIIEVIKKYTGCEIIRYDNELDEFDFAICLGENEAPNQNFLYEVNKNKNYDFAVADDVWCYPQHMVAPKHTVALFYVM